MAKALGGDLAGAGSDLKKSVGIGQHKGKTSKKKKQEEFDSDDDFGDPGFNSEMAEKKRNLQRQKKIEEFNDRGGFEALLKQIFTPTD